MWDFNLFGQPFLYVFYFFFICSFLGWIYESSFVSIKEHKLTNRGFLTGPWIPIYGAGGTLIMLVTTPFAENYFHVFIAGMLAATVLEYVTSYVMEKLFNLRWWDYSEWTPNLYGRVCLWASVFWGLLSITMQIFIKPAYEKLYLWIAARVPGVYYVGYVILVFFIADLSLSNASASQLTKKLAGIKARFVEFRESLPLPKGARISLPSLPAEFTEKFHHLQHSYN